MYELSISGNALEKLEKLGKEFTGLDNKIVKEALRKAINYVKKEEKKFIASRYTFKNKIDGKSLKSKITSTEGILLGSTKRNKVSDFTISKPSPAKSKEYMKTQIVKANGSKVWKTLFWAFYKRGTPRLMFRVGKEKYKISMAKTVSVRGMALQLSDEKVFNEIQNIFEKILEERINEVWKG